MNTIWHYPNCSTCSKARKWLSARGIEAKAIDLVAEPPSAEQVADLWKRSGLPLRKLFNVSGVSYRAGGWKDRLEATTEEEQVAALSADGKLLRRPILDLGGRVLVGFSEAAWEEAVA